jgi:hypothetical protein
MKGRIRWTCVGFAVALALGAPSAYAEGGTITFSGAVVTPTCAADSGRVIALSSGQRNVASSQQRFGCGGSSDASPTSTQSYELSVEPLEASALSSDRLISYFANYVRASAQEDIHMQLVTQAYE